MASLKSAIAEKCKQCTYDPSSKGTWREQTESCTVRSCALWAVRPLTVATITVNRTQRNELNIDLLVANLPDEEVAL